MKLTLVIFAITAVIPLLMSICGHAQEPAAKLAHTRTEFSFTVDAPFDQVVSLFGANEERKWADGWDPQFVYPTPARDQLGMIFRVAHGHNSSVWINTAFDLAAGHIQYAHVLNDVMATVIDIHANRQGLQKTAVSVVYERTALTPEANEHVLHSTKGDENAGKEWGDAMNAYFAKGGKAAK
jgi:hypothetical protein